MLAQKFRKVISTALCVSMVLAFQVPAIALADEGDGVGETPTEPSISISDVIADDYLPQDLGALYNDGKFTCDNENVKLGIDEDTGVLVVSGKRANLTAATFSLGKTFNFSDGAVGRFNVTGAVERGKKVTLGFYLDEATTPFVTATLKAGLTTGSWANPSTISTDVVGQAIAGERKLSVKVESCSSSAAFCLQNIEFSQASVPVVNIDIDESMGTIDNMNFSDNHTALCYGDVSVDVPAGCTSAMTGEALTGTDGALEMEYIRGRGNSTWNANKKPYKFKLDKSTDLLGMGKNKHWALMASAFDSSEIRNIMTSRLGQALGVAFTPSMEPVEVIMNGEYLGCYLLSEVTRVDETRVNIDEEDGYLLSLGNWSLDDDKLNFTTEQAKGVLQIENPDVATDKDSTRYNYIKNYVQEVEDAIYAKDFDKVSSMLDLNAAAMYYWFEEFSSNGDGYTSGSCYLYKEKDGKLCWGPLWDFDLAWSDVLYEGVYHRDNFWNNKMFQNPEFIAEVKATWASFSAGLDDLVSEGGTIDQLKSKMQVAVAYDNELWAGATESEETGGAAPVPVDEAFSNAMNDIEGLRSYIVNRQAWINKYFDSVIAPPIVSTSVEFAVDGKVVETRNLNVGEYLGKLPAVPEKKGCINGEWTCERFQTWDDILEELSLTEEQYRNTFIDEFGSEEELDEEIARLKKEGRMQTIDIDSTTPVFEGMVITASYTSEEDVSAVTKIHTVGDTVYGVYSEGNPERSLRLLYDLEPFEPVGNAVTLVSDNEDVVIQGDDSETLEIVGPGDATVTIKPTIGVSKTVKVHIYTVFEYAEIRSDLDTNPRFEDSSVTMTTDSYQQLEIVGISEGAVVEFPSIYSTNNDVVEVGVTGLVHAVSPGTATVYFMDENNDVSMVTVTVVDPASDDEPVFKVGSKVTVGSLKYQVTSMGKTRTVKCIGPKSSSIKTAKIPATVKIKGKTYKVTEVAGSAFKGCKKLTKVTVGKNVQVIGTSAFRSCPKLKTVTLGSGIQIVGKSAFRSCKKLTKVTFKSKNKPKVYSTAFKASKKAKFYVPKSQKKYYQLILGKKKVK